MANIPSLAAASRNNVTGHFGRTSEYFTKWFSLIMLMVQSLLFGICFRYASIRTRGGFSNLTVILVSEILKLLISVVGVMLTQEAGVLASMKNMMTQERIQTLLMGVPGVAFGVENLLFFIGQANLSVAMLQVSKQAAIPSTALMAFILLGQRQSLDKIIALCLVIVGVCTCTAKGDVVSTGDTSYGLLCVMAACACSGVANAYTEKLLKNCTFGIWERNVQLAAFGCLFAIAGICSEDPEILMSKRFFDGYGWPVVAVIVVQVLVGLLTAVVLKYADSVSKCVVKATAAVLGLVLSRVIFDEGPSLTSVSFVFGGVLVIYGSALYTLGFDIMVPHFVSHKVLTASSMAGNTVTETHDEEQQPVFGTSSDIEINSATAPAAIGMATSLDLNDAETSDLTRVCRSEF